MIMDSSSAVLVACGVVVSGVLMLVWDKMRRTSTIEGGLVGLIGNTKMIEVKCVCASDCVLSFVLFSYLLPSLTFLPSLLPPLSSRGK